MVNLILVSHSYTLACGVAELAEQMNNGCQIAVAAGMSEPENAIGTDAVKIMEAIESVYSEDGVLILMDLGSAILSAETALDLIDPDMAANVKLCSAPLVEGTLAAVVSASTGADLATVIKEAETALSAKQSQLSTETQMDDVQAETDLPPDSALTFSWTVQNPHGLHARPAAKLVEIASKFSSHIWVENQQKWADVKSYNQLIQLKIRKLNTITFHISGSDSLQALDGIKQLAENHFGEKVEANSDNCIQGIPVLGQTSQGQAVTFKQKFAKSEYASKLNQLEHVHERVQKAIHQTQQQLAEITNLPTLSENFSGVFQAHQLLLDELQDDIIVLLDEYSLEEACWLVFDKMIAEYEQLDDPYMQARALDIKDLRHRILHNLAEQPIQIPRLHENDILLADELYPSTLAKLLNTNFRGICLAQGDPLSHTALLAKSAKIPLIIQCGESLMQHQQGDKLQIDWVEGKVKSL